MSSNNPSRPVPLESLNIRNILVACQVKAKNVRCLINVIRCLSFTNNTEIHFSRTGLKYIAESSQFFQGSAYIKDGFFSDFRYLSDDNLVTFGIDLSKFTEFLSAFIDNNHCVLKIVYYGDDRPIAFIFSQYDSFVKKIGEDSEGESVLDGQNGQKGDQKDPVNKNQHPVNKNKDPVSNKDPYEDPDISDFDLEDPDDSSTVKDDEESAGNVVTEYVINTKDSINPVDFNALNASRTSLVVMDTRPFIECLHEFDTKTITDIAISVKKDKFVMRSLGVQQCQTKVAIKYDLHFVTQFEVDEETKFSYKYSCFKHMMKSLQMSSNMSIETFENGLARFQLIIKAEEKECDAIYIEFNMGANVEDSDDDDD